MAALFLGCAVLGSLILVAQIVMALFGVGGDSDVDPGGSDASAALELLSVRALAAGTAGFGLGGLTALTWGLPTILALAFALLPAAIALAGTAWLTRQMMRLESDGSFQMENAIGAPGTVRLSVPPSNGGYGKVQILVQGRTLELRAMTRDAQPLSTGTEVYVVGIGDEDTVEIVPQSLLREVLDD